MNHAVEETAAVYAPTIIPQLNSGDVLDEKEYFRRYAAAPEKLKAERINAKVYLMNALPLFQHGDPHALLAGWLFTYSMQDPDMIASDALRTADRFRLTETLQNGIAPT